MIETKVKAGSAGTLGGGGAGVLLVWLLVTYVPGFKTAPPEILALIPGALGWVAGTIAAYLAPHTNRPLPAPAPAPGPVAAVTVVPPPYLPSEHGDNPQ
jgi:hypothetical protein